MNFFLSKKWKINRLFNCCFIGMCSLFAILFSGFYFFSYPLPDLKMQCIEEKERVQKPLYPYELIGSSALALQEHHTSGWARRIANELFILGYNTRPDQSLKTLIAFSLDKGKHSFISQSGEVIFLEEGQEGLTYSEKKTGLWIQPILLDNSTVLIKAFRQSQVAEVAEQSAEFIASCSSDAMQVPEDDSIKQLQNGTYFNCDLLIQHYGGVEFAAWKEKGVLKCINQNGSYACFISEADLLVFKEDEWQVASTEIKTQGLPLAQVKKLSSQHLQLRVWNDKGFYSNIIEIPLKQKNRKKLDIPFTKVRMRSPTRVSCSLEKKRVFLKQGDWLFKGPSGWHRLSKPKDIERFLYHRLAVEVFIFDAIVKEQGCFFMKGALFDETRMQMQRIHLPVQAEKKETKMRKKYPLLFISKGFI